MEVEQKDKLLLLSEVARPAIDDLAPFIEELALREGHLKKVIGPVRESMLKEGQIGDCDVTPNEDGLQAVDAASLLLAQQGIAVALAVGARIAEHDTPEIEYIRKTGENTEDFNRISSALRLLLEFRLLKDATALTIIDNSFWSLLMESNKAITAYSQPTVSRVTREAFEEVIDECFSFEGSFISVLRNPNLVAISKTASSDVFSRERDINPSIADRTLLSKVLEVNEYTLPRLLSGATTGHFGIERREIADRDEIETIYKGQSANKIMVTFYKPWEYQRAYRIEYHDGINLIELLARVKHETRYLGIMEPVSQFLVDKLCKQIKEIAPLYLYSARLKHPDLIGAYRTEGF